MVCQSGRVWTKCDVPTRIMCRTDEYVERLSICVLDSIPACADEVNLRASMLLLPMMRDVSEEARKSTAEFDSVSNEIGRS